MTDSTTDFVTVDQVMVELGCQKSSAQAHLRRAAGRGPGGQRRALLVPRDEWQAYLSWRSGVAPSGGPGGPLSYADAARSLGVKHGTVRRWVHDGMPVDRSGAQPRIRLDDARAWISEHARPSTFQRSTVVYFVRRADGAVKIGFCGDIERRLAELGRAHGDLELLATMPGDKRTEGHLHATFAAHALGEEWFAPAPALLAFVEPLRGAA